MSPLPSNARRAQGRRLRRPSKVTPARWAAWLTLTRTFDQDAWTDRAFAAVVEQLGLEADPRERGFAQLLAYGTVQHAKRLDHVIGVLGKRPLHKLDPPVLHALRIGAFELLELQGATGPDGERLGTSSAHAAVDQAVELVRGVVGERAVAFTNAILRRAQVDGAGILAALDPSDAADLAVILSMPDWLVARARAGHADRGIDALRAQNGSVGPGAAFRVNTLHPEGARDAVTERLAEAGVSIAPQGSSPVAGPDAITITGSTAGAAAFVERGVLVPQSHASQLVAAALEPRPGERVLDMCAAPGGKTTHLAALMDGRGEIVATELHPHRADSVRALAERTRAEDIVEVRVADATSLEPRAIGGRFDRVLVDAPCSGTGVLAGRPDARWKRSETGLEELVALQRALLEQAAELVRPGGVVVYSTCSILVEEDEEVVASPPDELVPDALPVAFSSLCTSPHTARTWPHEHGTDGFFIARFRRREEGP